MQINGLAKYLFDQGALTKETAEYAYKETQQNRQPIINFLINTESINTTELARLTADYFRIDYIDLTTINKNDICFDAIDNNIIKKANILPIAKQQEQITLAVYDPTQRDLINELRFKTGLNIKLVVAEYYQLQRIINTLLEDKQFDEFQTEDAQIINLINRIMEDAINKKASDIHFEPYERYYRIRYRIDGILHEITKPDFNLINRITARLKIMAKLDIAERRLPQDGHFSITHHNLNHDCRISFCPTIYGEKIVVRILNTGSTNLAITELGLDKKQIAQFRKAITLAQGMIIVTGPTGSGKTVTLYAALNELNTVNKNILTIEDPVEMNLSGVNQVNINNKINLDFASVLRAFLRQDPDIIMVGEIRDSQTAEIAIKAAQTGHLVLSTLHTNNCAETITRLINMGIKTFNLHDSLNLIIAQRLARKLCPHCKQPYNPSEIALLELGFKAHEIEFLTFYQAQGCEKCSAGYQGRIGIFEVLPITETIRNLILDHKSSKEILQQAQKEGMLTLQQSALNKIREGLTTLQEISRVI